MCAVCEAVILLIVPGPSVIHLCVACSCARAIVALCLHSAKWVCSIGAGRLSVPVWVGVGGCGGSLLLNSYYLYRQASWGFKDCWDVWELEISNHTEVTGLTGMWVHLCQLCNVFICIFRMSNLALAVSLSIWSYHMYFCLMVINHLLTWLSLFFYFFF